MTDWPVKTLDALCDEGVVLLGRGNIISKKDIAADPGPYPIYSSARENDGKFGEYGAYMFNEEMITWSIDGGGRLFYRPKHKFSVTNVGGTLRVLKPDVLEIRYLHRALENLHSRKVFDWVFKAHPSVIRKVYDEIPVPSLEEQKRIVELLDAATARVTELTACYEQARTHANNLFASALRDALESNPDWPVKTLGQVATFHNGRAYKQQELLDKGKYRVLRVGNFFSSKSWYWSDLELDEHKYCDKGDLLYAWSASFGPRIWDEEKVIYHYHIWKVVEESQQINRQFLKYWLEEDVERVKSASGTGTTMMHVSKGNIEARLISLPPLEEQKQIVARLDSMKAKTSEMIAAYDAKLTAAKNLRQSILEAAFVGDL